ncbi:hypothetical protein L9F63_020536, partial [Diploptera punctata]
NREVLFDFCGPKGINPVKFTGTCRVACGSEISSAQMATLQPNGLLRTGHIETGKRYALERMDNGKMKNFNRHNGMIYGLLRELRRAATKEGFLMKQTWSFQRWRRRYFKLKGHKLYYAKDTKRLRLAIIIATPA